MYIPQLDARRIRHTDKQRSVMKYLFIINLLILLLLTSAVRAEERTYTFDPSHTSILFKIDHLGYSKMIGEFHRYEGTLVFDEKNPQASALEVIIYTDSVDTDVAALDKKLVAEPYFNTTKFPTAVFRSTGIEITGEKTGIVKGDLTMLGVTKPVELMVTLNKADLNPYINVYTAGFSASGKFYRSAFNMTEGLPFVGDEIELLIETEFNEVQPQPASAETPPPAASPAVAPAE